MKKFDRIIKHLEELERQTGSTCILEPREVATECPIWNFAPEFDKDGRELSDNSPSGFVIYVNKEYHIYTEEDSVWWGVTCRSISNTQKRRYTRRIEAWLKERSEK